MTIRDLAPDDLERVLEINEANADDVGSIDADRLRSLVGASAIAVVAETDDSRIAGFCLVLGPGSRADSTNHAWTRDRHPDALYVDRVAFDLSFSGLGLGVELYDELERRLEDPAAAGTGPLVVQVVVDPPNQHSIDFHVARGFSEIGRRPGGPGVEVSLVAKARTTPVDH